MNYYSRSNLAYDLTLFEEPREDVTAKFGGKAKDKSASADGSTKKNRDDRRARDAETSSSGVKRIRRRKSNFVQIAIGIIFALAVAFMIAANIHGQVQLTELNHKISNANAKLSEQQSTYTQLLMKVDSSVATTKVEDYAQNDLHMTKATNSQKEFVKLSDGDKAEVTMSEDKNLFERIVEAITSLWS